ncbi:MAG: ArsB/NhaD family transporter [Polyangia bacterium]
MTPSLVRASLVLAAVMLLVIARPRNLPIALSALLGAGACFGLHLVTLRDVVRVTSLTWNATLALVGLMLLSETLEANGAFRAAAHTIATRANGDGRRLFIGLALLTAGAATLLANDGAILILTPIVAELAAALAFSEAQTLAYLFAVGFLCDAMSTLLPTSNLTNILMIDALHINAGTFFAHMLLPTLALFVVATAVLAADLQRDLPRRFDAAAMGAPPPFSRRSSTATWTALGFLLIGYSAATFTRLPLGLVVLAVGGGLLVYEQGWGAVDARALLGRQPWSIIVFAVALFIVVFALANAGAARALAELLDPGGRALVPALIIAGVAVALLSAGVNNLPVFLVALLALRHLGTLTHDARPATLPYAALLGANVGSKLTPLGSLATLLWLDMLARRGVRVGWARYTRLALLPTAAALLAALAALALSERLFH